MFLSDKYVLIIAFYFFERRKNMDTEKYCSPVSTQLFLDLSSIESKDGQRDTYNDFLNIYVLKNIKHFENAGVCDDFDTLAAHYYLSDVMIFGKLCAILNKQENKRKVLLEANDLRDIHLIINRLRPDMIARGDMMSVDDVTEILAVDLIGTLLDDEQIVIATNQGEPLSGKNSQAEEEYQNICKRLMGEEVPFAELRQKKGMFSRLFKRH